MSRHTITREELEKEFAKLGITENQPDHSVRTSNEWADHWSCSQHKAIALLRTAKEHGLIRVVNKTIMRLDDKKQDVGAYQFLNESGRRRKTK